MRIIAFLTAERAILKIADSLRIPRAQAPQGNKYSGACTGLQRNYNRARGKTVSTASKHSW